MTPTLHTVQPNTPEWLELRKGYRTASEFPIVLGISPFTTREKFKLIKAGIATQWYSAAMRRGHETEAKTREWANKHFGLVFDEQIWTRGQYLASLDGIDAGVVLEIKASTYTYKSIENGEIPAYYAAQIQQQLFCSGAEKAYLVAFCPKTERYIASDPIFPDPTFLATADAAWAEFDAMPLPDGPADASDNLNLALKLDDYASLKEKIERLTEQLDALREEILTFKAPDRSVLCRGHEIVYKRPATKVDYRTACKDAKLDLKPYTTTASEPSYAIKIAPPVFAPDEEE